MTAQALPLFQGPGAIPGMSTLLQTVENQVWFGDILFQETEPILVTGVSRDAGNTNATTSLRAGLLMAKTATGVYKQWDPFGTVGDSRITHVLIGMLQAQRNGVNTDSVWAALRIGKLKANGVIIPGNTEPGLTGANRFLAAQQLLDAGFDLDNKRDYVGESFLVIAANYAPTNLEDIHNRHILCDTSGVTLTLPTTPAYGFTCKFTNTSAGNCTIDLPGATDVVVDAGNSARVSVIRDATTAKYIVEEFDPTFMA